MSESFLTRIGPLWGPYSRLALTLAGACYAADQAFKWVMLGVLDFQPGDKITVTPFFDLVMTWNFGISYGLFQAETVRGWLILLVLAILVVGGLIVWLGRVDSRLTAFSLGLIIGGALGNITDRLVHGAVADFFSFHAWGFYWYIFNIADIWIVVGVALLLLDSFLGDRDTQSTHSER